MASNKARLLIPRAGLGQRGVAIIEFAIVVFFLLLLVVGITEIGRAFWYYSAMQKAVRDSARCYSMVAWIPGNDTSACLALIDKDVKAAGVPDLDVSTQVSHPGGGWGGGESPKYVSVAIEGYTIHWLWGFGSTITPGGSASISLSATMPYMH